MTDRVVQLAPLRAARRGPLSLAALATALPAPAGADTDPTALVGEGGSFLTPVTDVLLKADTGLCAAEPVVQRRQSRQCHRRLRRYGAEQLRR